MTLSTADCPPPTDDGGEISDEARFEMAVLDAAARIRAGISLNREQFLRLAKLALRMTRGSND